MVSSTPQSISPPSHQPLDAIADGLLILPNVTWEALERLDVEFATTGARLTYLDGTLRIMAPLSEAHETPKKTLALVLETYMRLKQIRFYAQGSATIGMKALGARKEPDESYSLETLKKTPDLALEITVTSGGIDVLEIYRRVGVREVWFWEDGVISVYCLRETGYELVEKSELLPELNLRLVEFCSRMADQYDAVSEFIAKIR